MYHLLLTRVGKPHNMFGQLKNRVSRALEDMMQISHNDTEVLNLNSFLSDYIFYCLMMCDRLLVLLQILVDYINSCNKKIATE